MFQINFRKCGFVFLLALLMMPFGNARAADASSTPATSSASSGSTTPGIVSGTDPEPSSPDIIQAILTILSLG